MAALAIGLGATSCLGPDPVLGSGVEPVVLQFEGPTYAAATPRGLLVRNGDEQLVLRGATDGRWLPTGRALVRPNPRKIDVRLVDPGRGYVSEVLQVPDLSPGRSVTQVNLVDRYAGNGTRLNAYTTELERLWSIELPETDNPDADTTDGLERNYYGVAPTVSGVTFVQWHDSSETYDEGDYGVARIEDGEVENVLLNERIVALYLSADGSGLLALRQASGEPCGGCEVDQEIVEIDPATGELSDYGVPDGYDESWRVDAMDKVGDRVAVRYLGDGRRLVGTYVYAEGEWSLLEGSDEEITWWQGDDRVVARPRPEELARRGLGDGYALFWLHDGRETPLSGELEAEVGRWLVTGSVAGQLLPPS